MSIKELANNAYKQDLERINSLIEGNGAKKYFIAKQLGISRTTLNDYLNGIHDIPLSVYRELEALLVNY